MIIILNSGAGFLGYLGHVPLNWNLMISFTIAASLGIIGGAYFSRFVKPKQLQRGFGYFLIAVATFVLFQNRNKFLSSYLLKEHPIRQEQSVHR